LCDFVHEDAEKVAAGLSTGQQLGRKIARIQFCPGKALTANKGLNDFLAVRRIAGMPKAWDQHLVDGKITPIDGKATGRKEHVVKKVGSRPMAAHNEHWEPAAVGSRTVAVRRGRVVVFGSFSHIVPW